MKVLIFILLFLAVAGRFIDHPSYHGLVVATGSMSPTIRAGSFIVVRRTSAVSRGDIITFRRGGQLVTHRVVKIIHRQPEVAYITKGDANRAVDPSPVRASAVVGRMVIAIPYIGWIGTIAHHPLGFMVIVILPALYIIGGEAKAIFHEYHRSSTITYILIVMVGSLPLLFHQSLSGAYYLDTAVAVGNVFSSSPSVGPTPGDVAINEINWAGSSLSTSDEWIELRNMTGNTVDLGGWQIENLGGSSTASATISVPAGKTIAAHGYFLISNAGKSASRINVDPDLVTTGISLLDTGEQLRLRTVGGILVDTANGSGAWYRGSKGPPKKSMERQDIPGDGSVASSWQDATTHTNMDGSGTSDEFGTPRAPNGL